VCALFEGKCEHGLAVIKSSRANLEAGLLKQKAFFELPRFALSTLESGAPGKLRRCEAAGRVNLRHAEHQIAFISLDDVPGVRTELVLNRVYETGGSIDPNNLFSPEKESQQLVEACKVVHMPMCDKDITDTQELARSKPAKVAEIEKQRAPLEHEIHVKPGIFEGIVDKRRIKVTRHGAARLNLYGSSV
jgi:hypothetical protein